MQKLNNFIIRGSSAGLLRHGEFLGDSASICPRRTILRHLEIEETHSAITKEVFSIGHYFEKYFEKLHPECEFEKLVTIDGVLQGHSDAVSADMVYELKSVTSKNTKTKVIKNGHPKTDNVLQLATYLLALERTQGKLIYGDFTHISTYDKLTKMRPSDIAPLFENAIPVMKEFLVEIDDNGFVLVDGENFYNINVTELIEFQDKLHELVKSRTLPPRIEPLESNSWTNACKWCKLAPLCDSGVEDLEEFVDLAQEIYEQQI